MNTLYKKASELEEPSPEEALGIYKELEDENSEFHTSILLAGIIFPILAYLISFVVVQYISGHRTIVTVLILSVVGFAPPLLMVGTKIAKKEKRHEGRERSSIEVASVVLVAHS